MIKETGYCKYYDMEWVEKYSGLTYNEYLTKIEGNTFYIKKIDNFIKNTIFMKYHPTDKTICVIPMIKAQEETIRDVLRSWNFNVKYEWLDEDIEPIISNTGACLMSISNRIIKKLVENEKTISEFKEHFGYSNHDIARLLTGNIILPPKTLEEIGEYLNTTKQYFVTGDEPKKLLDCGDSGNMSAKKCPTCGYIDPCDFEDVYDVKYEYCPMCGQKLDREESPWEAIVNHTYKQMVEHINNEIYKELKGENE